MDPGKGNYARSPFGDLTNTGSGGVQNASNSVIDPKERKRARERARTAAMSEEQRKERNKKCRESYQRKKAPAGAALNKENVDPTENNDWLHRNDSYEPQTIENENTSPGQMQPLSTPDSIITKENHGSVTSTPLVDKPRIETKSRSNYFRERYKNMTPDDRETRRERQRLHNTIPERKIARKACKARLKELRKNNLNPESIAMENPQFVPKIIHPTVDASGPYGSILSHDWPIPELNRTPIYIPSPSDLVPDVEPPDMHPARITNRCHVTPGERHSLLARRNQQFEATIGRKAKGLAEENDDIIEKDISEPQLPTQSVVINNEDDENVIYEDDDEGDDEDVIFEEEEEDEGYLFAGQGRASFNGFANVF